MTLPVEHRHERGYRRDRLWSAAMVHRVSGVLLACFLPLHFLALGLAIEGEAALNGFLTWTDQPIVKFAEMGLVFLLAVHLLGGIRIMMVETMAWRPGQVTMATSAFVVAAALAILFVVRIL